MEEKIDAILEGVKAILKHLGEQAVAADLEKRRGKFGEVSPPLNPTRKP